MLLRYWMEWVERSTSCGILYLNLKYFSTSSCSRLFLPVFSAHRRRLARLVSSPHNWIRRFPLAMPKKYDFGFTHRPALRLARVEEILAQTQIIDPVPSRRTLIREIEEGVLAGKKLKSGWIVYEDSFKAWVRSHQPEDYMLRT